MVPAVKESLREEIKGLAARSLPQPAIYCYPTRLEIKKRKEVKPFRYDPGSSKIYITMHTV